MYIYICDLYTLEPLACDGIGCPVQCVVCQVPIQLGMNHTCHENVAQVQQRGLA